MAWLLYLILTVITNGGLSSLLWALLFLPLYLPAFYGFQQLWHLILISRCFRKAFVYGLALLLGLPFLVYAYLYVLLPLVGLNAVSIGFDLQLFLLDVGKAMWRFVCYALIAVLLKKQKRLEFENLQVVLSIHTQMGFLNKLKAKLEQGKFVMQKALQHFSVLWRYTLQYQDERWTSLVEEVDAVKRLAIMINMNYVLENPKWIVLKGNLEEVCIPPLLLVGLVENAFKYGDTTVQDGLHVGVDCRNVDEIVMVCRNIIGARKLYEESFSIGMDTMIRLLWVCYGTQFKVDVAADNVFYKVEIRLPKKVKNLKYR